MRKFYSTNSARTTVRNRVAILSTSDGFGSDRLAGPLYLGFPLDGIAQDVAASPYRLDVMVAAGGLCQLLAQLADEDVDDLHVRFVHPAIEMVEEHLLGQGQALAQAEQFEDAVFLGGQMQRLVASSGGTRVKIEGQLAGADY